MQNEEMKTKRVIFDVSSISECSDASKQLAEGMVFTSRGHCLKLIFNHKTLLLLSRIFSKWVNLKTGPQKFIKIYTCS